MGAVAVLAWLLHAAAATVASAQAVASPELRADAARIFQDLARLRGLPIASGPPRVVLRSRDERRRFVAGELARKYPPARLEAERRGLVAWGLVPPGFDLGSFLIDLVVEQAAAYYDPVGKTMVIANWLGPEEQRSALAHELAHALQDRQVDLDRFLSGGIGSDEALARQALIEGEAVALTLDLTLRRQGQDLARLPDLVPHQRAILASATGPLLGRAPRFLRATLMFPYAQGLGFVHQFRRQRPWVGLSALYRDPPRSTAQILHPERYLDRREDPLPLALPDLRALLGPGSRRVIEDDIGEFGVTEILKQFLEEDATIGHWRGDRYALWEDPTGTLLLGALSVWDTADAAAGFAGAYSRLVSRKHGVSNPVTVGTLTVWQVGGQAYVVEQRGREVLLIERAPISVADGIRGAIWGSRLRAHRYRAPARLSSTMPASITPAPSEISRTR